MRRSFGDLVGEMASEMESGKREEEREQKGEVCTMNHYERRKRAWNAAKSHYPIEYTLSF